MTHLEVVLSFCYLIASVAFAALVYLESGENGWDRLGYSALVFLLWPLVAVIALIDCMWKKG